MRSSNDVIDSELGQRPLAQSGAAGESALRLEIEVLEARIAPGQPVLQFLGGPSNLSPQNAFFPRMPHGEPVIG